MDNLTSNIKEYLSAIPDSLRAYVLATGWTDVLHIIVSNHALTEEQASALENEVAFILLGIDLYSNFQTNLKNELRLSDMEAKKLADDVDTKIFDPVKQPLLDLQNTIVQNQGEEEPIIEESSDQPDTLLPMVTASDATLENREDILHEIEDPTPVQVPIAPKPVMQKPVIPEMILPKMKTLQSDMNDQKNQTKTPSAVASSLFASKLADKSGLPKQANVVKDLPKIPQKPGMDPYREAIE